MSFITGFYGQLQQLTGGLSFHAQKSQQSTKERRPLGDDKEITYHKIVSFSALIACNAMS